MQIKQKFYALDGLRGIAALTVAIGHLGPIFSIQTSYGDTALAVDFFFMLSGFVIAHAYAYSLSSDLDFFSFIRRRITRLYPLIVIAIVIATTLALLKSKGLASTSSNKLNILRLAFQGALLIPEMRPNLIDNSFLPLNPPSWSLFFEMVASIMYGIGFWRGRKALSLLTWLASVGFVIVVANTGTFDTGFSYNTAYLGLFRMLFAFGTGALLQNCAYTLSSRLPKYTFLVLTVVMPFWLLSPYNDTWLQLVFISIYSPLLIIAGAQIQAQRRLVEMVCNFSGEMSYPLYILHWPIFCWIRAISRNIPINIPSLALGVGAIFISIYFSALILIYVDKPVRRFISQRM